MSRKLTLAFAVTSLVAVAQPDHAFKLDAGLSGLLAAAIGAVVALVGNRRKPEAETAKKLADIYKLAMERDHSNAPTLEAGYGNDAKRKLGNLFD